MRYMRIRLELARSREFPEGSSRHGFTLIVPLAPDARLDRSAFSRNPEICTVHRFWEGEGDEVGHLIRRAGGGWAFSFRAEDEPIHRLDQHVFSEGDYLTIRERDGQSHTFRIAEVQPAPGLGIKAASAG